MELSRRDLVLSALRAGLGVSAAALAACATPRRATVLPTAAGAPLRSFDPATAAVLAAALDTLLPTSAGIPGAATVNALGYLDGILAAPRAPAGDRDALRDGVPALQERARSGHGAAFETLSPAARESLLRAHESDDDGRAWMALLLVYALEALLTDPIYGGNRAAAGWAWLGHQPGYPRPEKPWWET